MTAFIDILTRLTDIPSVSGFEKDAAGDVIDVARSLGFDSVECDPVGNIVIRRNTRKTDAPTIILDAHIDEIGFRVQSILDNGFICAVSVGGIDPVILPSSEVTVHGKDKLRGIVSLPEDAKDGKPKKVYIDTAYSAERLRSIVSVGDAVSFHAPIVRLCGDKIIGHAFDDKSLAAILLLAVAETPTEKLAFNVCVTLSSREEVGGGGAACAAADIRPVCAIVTDVNFATVPGVPSDESGEAGLGPMISLSAVTDRPFTDQILALAHEKGIRMSPVVESSNTGTNANLLYISGYGIPCAVVSLPEAGMHTFSECISLSDVRSLISLLTSVITNDDIAARLSEREVSLDV